MTTYLSYGFLLNLWEKAEVLVPCAYPLESHCHALITGSSGSGKSTALLYLLGKLLKSHPEIELHFCDFKASEDFRFLSGYKYYYAGDACYTGIMTYLEAFNHARENFSDAAPSRLLIFDEYPAFLLHLQQRDKLEKTKKEKEVLAAVSSVLMMGRGIRHYLWIVAQRPDSTYFPGSRHNFMVLLHLGHLTKEEKTMLFSGENLPERIFSVGEGLILADGDVLQEVKFPLISDIEDWKKHILDILCLGDGA